MQPKPPSYKGKQYDDDAGSPAPIDTHFTEDAELPTSDPKEHEGYETPGEGAFNWSGSQYATDFKDYGVKVDDDGQNPKASQVGTNVASVERGKEK